MKNIVVLLLTGAASAGVDDTLAQKEAWATYAAELTRVTTKVNATCGSSITGSWDKSSFETFDPATDPSRGACEMAVTTLSAICTTDAGKESVRALRTVTCRHSTIGTTVKRDGTKLEVWVDPVKTGISGLKGVGNYSWASALREIL